MISYSGEKFHWFVIVSLCVVIAKHLIFQLKYWKPENNVLKDFAYMHICISTGMCELLHNPVYGCCRIYDALLDLYSPAILQKTQKVMHICNDETRAVGESYRKFI